MKKLIKNSLLTMLILSATGCVSIGVEPWQRDLLAKDEMSLSGGLDAAVDDHVYCSKEASSGGRSFGGGGCGCN